MILPVKKNKFGERVAEISTEKYYRQIMEEVLEAHADSVTTDFVDKLNREKIIGDYENEAEELVDVIACYVTRLDIIGCNDVDMMVSDALNNYCEQKNFYTDLATAVIKSFYSSNSPEITARFEERRLSIIIAVCIKRLEYLGYDETARQKMYEKVNEKNRKRGYFD